MSFRHNSVGIDPDNTIALMPDGWYTMKITEAEEMTSSTGYPMILAKCSPVNNPDFADASIWNYVAFIPKGEKGDGISVHFRKAIGVPFGGDDVVDADEWVGKKFSAYVIRETYKGKTRNKFKEVRSLTDQEADLHREDEVPF